MLWKRLLLLFSVRVGCTWGTAKELNALKTRSWQGLPAVQEVECSGSALDPDADLLSITLYSSSDNLVLTSVNLRKEECSTAHVYSACAVDHVNSRNTRVLCLVMDLGAAETRMLGCNITSFKSGGVSSISSWSLAVQRGVGFSSNPFYDSSSITELVCSGKSLDTTTDVMSIALFVKRENRVISFVNIAKRECSTNGNFAACVINDVDTRGTEARALVTQKIGSQYGCNVTVVRPERLVAIITWYLTVTTIGLTVRAFKGVQHIQELQCSGEELDSDTHVLLMTLFTFPNDRVIASASLGGDQCSTSSMFSSCVLDRVNSRRTKIRTLLLDFQDGELRRFGCNVTTAKSGGRAFFISWSLMVKITRMTVHQFYDSPHVQEIHCSGKALDPSTDLLSLAMFAPGETGVMAFVNLAKGECATFRGFAACVMDQSDTRNTVLKALVVDLRPGASRKFGCNVTVLNSSGISSVLAWSVVVTSRHPVLNQNAIVSIWM